LIEMKAGGKPIVMLTAYDYPTARLIDQAGVDVILVGDSLGMVVLGYSDTIPVTLDQMIHHAAAVKRGVSRALLVGDMPYLSTGITPEQTVMNAGRLIKESGVQAVKLEGGMRAVAEVEALVRAQIPVMGHIGLTPQSVNVMGGYRVQGRGEEAIELLVADAQALEAAGCRLLLHGAGRYAARRS
jgi:3-methyl-2-oxobutanoate hydroxymethyltransferase